MSFPVNNTSHKGLNYNISGPGYLTTTKSYIAQNHKDLLADFEILEKYCEFRNQFTNSLSIDLSLKYLFPLKEINKLDTILDALYYTMGDKFYFGIIDRIQKDIQFSDEKLHLSSKEQSDLFGIFVVIIKSELKYRPVIQNQSLNECFYRMYLSFGRVVPKSYSTPSQTESVPVPSKPIQSVETQTNNKKFKEKKSHQNRQTNIKNAQIELKPVFAAPLIELSPDVKFILDCLLILRHFKIDEYFSQKSNTSYFSLQISLIKKLKENLTSVLSEFSHLKNDQMEEILDFVGRVMYFQFTLDFLGNEYNKFLISSLKDIREFYEKNSNPALQNVIIGFYQLVNRICDEHWKKLTINRSYYDKLIEQTRNKKKGLTQVKYTEQIQDLHTIIGYTINPNDKEAKQKSFEIESHVLMNVKQASITDTKSLKNKIKNLFQLIKNRNSTFSTRKQSVSLLNEMLSAKNEDIIREIFNNLNDIDILMGLVDSGFSSVENDILKDIISLIYNVAVAKQFILSKDHDILDSSLNREKLSNDSSRQQEMIDSLRKRAIITMFSFTNSIKDLNPEVQQFFMDKLYSVYKSMPESKNYIEEMWVRDLLGAQEINDFFNLKFNTLVSFLGTSNEGIERMMSYFPKYGTHMLLTLDKGSARFFDFMYKKLHENNSSLVLNMVLLKNLMAFYILPSSYELIPDDKRGLKNIENFAAVPAIASSLPLTEYYKQLLLMIKSQHINLFYGAEFLPKKKEDFSYSSFKQILPHSHVTEHDFKYPAISDYENDQ